jgi:hypothetical protein
VYVEEKGDECTEHAHRRNHAIPRVRVGVDQALPLVAVARAS